MPRVFIPASQPFRSVRRSDHENGLRPPGGFEPFEPHSEMRFRSLGDMPADQRRLEVGARVPAGFVGEMRSEMPGLVVGRTNHEQSTHPVRSTPESRREFDDVVFDPRSFKQRPKS